MKLLDFTKYMLNWLSLVSIIERTNNFALNRIVFTLFIQLINELIKSQPIYPVI